KYKVPRIAFVNKMDRTGADFFDVVTQIRERLLANPVAIQIPIGSEDQFKGLIDLITMKALEWHSDDQGAKFDIKDIPAELQEKSREYGEKLIEAAADCDDAIMEKYMGGEQPTPDELKKALRKGCLAL